ncbi:MAG: 6,7-dimethyl-8-ribityllumazine synthase [Acidobacteriota bacterium]|nr:6,7-dimethyl-8-ribityllumazine synthase [Acidobacteriota bacterium]MDQ5872002.1 6,7-dimethyl-8-ribityllumazine synthase [Acidobacteriota bacterium]
MSNRAVRRVASVFTPRERSGSLDAKGLRIGVICARWNPTVTDALLVSALDSLASHGAQGEDTFVVRVPGAFELAVAARDAIDTDKPNAIVALGAIIRGETTHHDVLAHAVAGALALLSAETGIPIGFGLLTCDTMEQARDRASKGAEAAEAAIEMANLRRRPRGK